MIGITRSGQSQVDTLKQQITDMQAQLRALTFSNPTAAFREPFAHGVSAVSKSVTIGGNYPALADFGDITSIEFQSPFKVQVAATIVPTGDPRDGYTIFGIINETSGGVYACSLQAQAGGGLPTPIIGFLSTGGHPNSIAILQSTGSTQYPWMFGSGSLSLMSGTGVLQINGDTQKLFSAKRTPASSAATGYLGEVCFDDSFLYIYTSAGWKRTALAAF